VVVVAYDPVMEDPGSDPTVTDRIIAMLSGAGVPFRRLVHEPTPTSEDSARVREEPIEIGGKALVCKANDRFLVVVLSAVRRLDSKRLRRELNARSIRFATREELMDLTGLVPGSVPPFGRPVLDLELIVDRSTLANERIAFNAGALTESIIMATGDWLDIAAPDRVVDVAESP